MIKYKILILTSGKKITETIQKLIHKKAKHYEIKAVCSDKNTKLRNNISLLIQVKVKEGKILKIIKSKNKILLSALLTNGFYLKEF